MTKRHYPEEGEFDHTAVKALRLGPLQRIVAGFCEHISEILELMKSRKYLYLAGKLLVSLGDCLMDRVFWLHMRYCTRRNTERLCGLTQLRHTNCADDVHDFRSVFVAQPSLTAK